MPFARSVLSALLIAAPLAASQADPSDQAAPTSAAKLEFQPLRPGLSLDKSGQPVGKPDTGRAEFAPVTVSLRARTLDNGKTVFDCDEDHDHAAHAPTVADTEASPQ
ncbi:MAG: hypothetical protein WCZ65_09160 [Lysobacteraceae bacterium]